VRSEELDRRIVVQTPVETQSSTGFVETTWTHYMTLWAKYMPQKTVQKTAEFQQASKVNAEAMTVFKVRFRRDISVKMRILFESRSYNIVEVRELGRRDALEIVTRAELS